jgi:hypothetical protein
MVTVRILDGHMAGQTIDASSAFGFSPQDILCGVSGYKWRWETDLSQATDEERHVWARQDLTMRIVRALAQRTSVTVLGRDFDRTYRSNSLQDAFHVAAEIEDFVLDNGYRTTVESDDHSGMIIGTR